jgi:hypothetical protein
MPAKSRQAIEHARQICLAAARAIESARVTLGTSQTLYAEREHWRQVWSDLRGAGPDYFTTCCAYCGRVQTREGTWGPIPSGINQIIHGTGQLNLTHDICPDCQPRVFPTMPLST